MTGDMNTLEYNDAPIDTTDVVLRFIDNSQEIAQPMDMEEL